MSNAVPSISLVLAGPILRRIERARLAIWMVLTKPIEPTITFSQDINVTQNIKTLSAAENLHYLLINLTLDAELPTDEWIDYQIELDGQNLVSLSPDLLYPNKSSLGFIIPNHIGSVLHGSCRKPHHQSEDGLIEADRLLAKLINSDSTTDSALPTWPSLLVMSGDQIYSDDVAGPMLRAIHSVIEKLDLPAEKMKGLGVPDIENSIALYGHHDCYYGRADILPKVKGNRALLDMLFDGVKKPIFTTDTAHNHLISLHEHLIMYLLVWSPEPWKFADLSEPAGLSPENSSLYKEEQEIIEHFKSELNRVRRLFAHIPVAMIFDDHDITDDWNLNREWEEAVYGHPFSKRMIANGLSAYFLCQAWGNCPEKFQQDFIDEYAEMLRDPGCKTHQVFHDHILKFEGWEYEWKTEPPLIVIDSRTRRWRSENSMVKPSGLLDWEALCDIQQKLYGNKSVLLVSPAPIYGMKLIETIQGIFTWFGKPLVVDAENWMAHPGTANSILNIFRHSKTPQNFVILSGDVHYSFVYDVELRKTEGGPDIWQVTSSGLRNEFPKKLLDILDVLNRWLYSPRSPLNWFTKRKRMRIIPRKPDGHADGRRLLNAAGIGLVELNETGQPWRIRQLVAGGEAIEFNRMERHSRWQ
ncbi:MAG: alkaline phosphatase family protein [Rhodospirillales bacterium]|nr:alkaline phosphatase family protein [Rhodospirillales bacterium]